MKQRLFIFALLTAAAFGANAQTEQGNFLIGGNLGLNTGKNDINVTINPTAGYFFTDNFAAGANINLNHTKTGDGDNAAKNTRFGFGPFVRYYVGTSNVRPFLHGDVDFFSQKTQTGSLPSSKTSGFGYFIGPGAAIFLNRNVALEGLAGYSHSALKDEDGSGGFGFKLGFQVYLNRAEVKTVTNTQ